MDLLNEAMAKRLQDMCRGSSEAFDAFYCEYAPFVLRIAERIVGERMEAEDICHDVFLEVLRRGAEYDPARGSIRAWLAVMTRSRSLDRLRRKQRVRPLADREGELPEQAAAGQEEEVLARLEGAALRAALNSLPAPQKRAVVASYFEYLTQAQMADTWKVPIGTVKSWIRYGVSNLRKQMYRAGWMEQTGEGEPHERKG